MVEGLQLWRRGLLYKCEQQRRWFMDCGNGALKHMINRDGQYVSLGSMGDGNMIAVGNGETCLIKGVGMISFKMNEGSTM